MAYLCSVGALAILAIPGGSRATGPNTLGNGQFVTAPGKRHRTIVAMLRAEFRALSHSAKC